MCKNKSKGEFLQQRDHPRLQKMRGMDQFKVVKMTAFVFDDDVFDISTASHEHCRFIQSLHV